MYGEQYILHESTHILGVKRKNGQHILGDAHCTDKEQLNHQFEYFGKTRNKMAPGYHNWFYKNQLDLFITSVIKSA